MGLMLLFPVSEEETDRIKIKDSEITLMTYGLPFVFWGYLLAILSVSFAMGLAIKGPMLSLYQTSDISNKILVIAAASVLILVPLVTFCSFFYEKHITKSGTSLKVSYKIFWTTLYTKHFTLKSPDSLQVLHFMDSPNVAKMKGAPELKGFENKGYFQLFFEDINGKLLYLDRHSRKADLLKIAQLLSKY